MRRALWTGTWSPALVALLGVLLVWNAIGGDLVGTLVPAFFLALHGAQARGAVTTTMDDAEARRLGSILLLAGIAALVIAIVAALAA